ncbi:putative cyclase dehydrase family protein [Phaeoacremonium minimum UCRPA7]|uniref:Putative cyclase dehydrase family protein n=1 Tax=Phaeoacremonium minimum (strain UCR-PA7) TaxID=1286976 RepID=R8BIK6_PHAM7|nr:putative cyclase dehydrase family protein [Phaeoacremonium minimum UCRPA7]EON99163.1 putative cyclase dehydrase family protein [Phaeoacremonium minimum UCRPA7]
MATKLPLRIAAPVRPRPFIRLPLPQQRRTFLSELGKALGADPSKPARINVSRTLPHSSWDLYTLIADVDSYRDFVPFCTSSRVTRWTAPDPQTGQKWPAEADLTVGAFGFTQTYTSRLRCVPGVSVEALSGEDALAGSETETEAGPEPLRKTAASQNSVFRSLITKWTVTPVEKAAAAPGGGGGRDWTAVDLSILFHFANPAHQIAMSSMSEEQARRMIAAFEQRAKEMFGRKQR